MLEGRVPIFRIMRGDTDITDLFQDRATRIEIKSKERSGEGDEFEVDIDDRDFLLDVPFPEDPISFMLGYKELGMSDMGKFEMGIVRHHGPPATLTVTGSSQGYADAHRAPAIANFSEQNLGAIITKAFEHSKLIVKVGQKFTGIKIPHLNQFSSAMHMVNDLARRYNAIARFTNGFLLFMERDVGETISGNSLPMFAVRREDIASWDVTINERPAYEEVQVAWWSDEFHVRIFEKAKVFPTIPMVGNSGTFVSNEIAQTREEAIARAQSRANALARMTRRITLTLAKGNPWVKAGIPMIVTGMRDTVDGNYMIDLVTHTYTKNQGIETVIEAHAGDDTYFADTAKRPWLETPLGMEPRLNPTDIF